MNCKYHFSHISCSSKRSSTVIHVNILYTLTDILNPAKCVHVLQRLSLIWDLEFSLYGSHEVPQCALVASTHAQKIHVLRRTSELVRPPAPDNVPDLPALSHLFFFDSHMACDCASPANVKQAERVLTFHRQIISSRPCLVVFGNTHTSSHVCSLTAASNYSLVLTKCFLKSWVKKKQKTLQQIE